MYRVLIVEDNPSDAKILEFIMNKRKYEAVICSEAHQAFEHLKVFPFDLLLLDWQLPQVSGLEILRTLRKENKHKSLPVIVISGKNEARDIQSAIQSGASDYIIKPLDPLVLDSKINKLLKKENDWKLVTLPPQDAAKAVATCGIQVLKLSEVGMEIRTGFPLAEGTCLTVTLDLLGQLAMPPLEVKVYACQKDQQEGFLSLCSLVGLKETDMQKIRVYLRLVHIDDRANVA